MSDHRSKIVSYLKNLRENIIVEFEGLEAAKSFERKTWDYSKGAGGGEMSVLRGDVFEKAAVNWSGLEGKKLPHSETINHDLKEEPFFASGVSLITHMANPKAPTVHFNIRYFEMGDKWWFGGGYDLTPTGFEFAEDTEHFHKTAQENLDKTNKDLYPKFSAEAKEYFSIKHYNKERGVGGIFFDFYNTGDFEKDLAMWQSVGDSFTQAIMPIYQKRIHEKFNEADRETQLYKRAHYVEFNLLYDRGTRFGFQSGGNPEAILCSMPPLVRW